MRDKLRPMLNDVAGRVTLSTIHSFCYTILKPEGKSFELLHGAEQIRFVRTLMKKHRIRTLSPGQSCVRSTLPRTTSSLHGSSGRSIWMIPRWRQSGNCIRHMKMRRQKSYLLDFNDLIIETCQLLKNTPEIREEDTSRHFVTSLWMNFQDTDPAQAEILKLLVGRARTHRFT